MTETPELEPCPFCGSTMQIYSFDDEGTASDGGRRVRVECAESEMCSANTGWCDSMEDAQGLWNTRPLEARTEAALEEAREALKDAKSFLEIALKTSIVHKSRGKGGHDGDGNSWTEVGGIPEWRARQMLEEWSAALAAKP